MYLSPSDYKAIFTTQELMERVIFKEHCWIWKGSYTNKKSPIFIFRYDGSHIKIHPAKILGMIVMNRKIRLGDRVCKKKGCVNPGHYLPLT